MEKMEKKFSDNENIGIFDIEMSNLDNIQHKNLTKDVTGFPTMRYVKGNVCEDYEKCDGITTDRSYSSFLDWINKKTVRKMLYCWEVLSEKESQNLKKNLKRKQENPKKSQEKNQEKEAKKPVIIRRLQIYKLLKTILLD